MGMLPNCDRCGCFMVPGSPGSSWVNVPHTDVNIGDERDRCARCTKRWGPARCSSGFVRELCEGVAPEKEGSNGQDA